MTVLSVVVQVHVVQVVVLVVVLVVVVLLPEAALAGDSLPTLKN